MLSTQNIARRHLEESRVWQEVLKESIACQRVLKSFAVNVSEGTVREHAADLMARRMPVRWAALRN